MSLIYLVVGIPFHSEQLKAHAPCPLCTSEKNDASVKTLFFVVGTRKGQYDSRIPEAYFQTPPSELVSGGTGFAALRVRLEIDCVLAVSDSF